MSSATEAKTPRPSAKSSKRESVSVRFSDVSQRIFANYRTKRSDASYLAKKKVYNTVGMSDPPTVSSIPESCKYEGPARYAIATGYGRWETMVRMLIEGLVLEYNKSKGLSSGDPGYIPLWHSKDVCEDDSHLITDDCKFGSELAMKMLRDAGEDWADKLESLLQTEIELTRKDCKSAAAAAALNHSSNENVDAVGTWDRANSVRRMIEQEKFSQTKVASIIGKTQGLVSYLLLVSKLPETIRALLLGDAGALASQLGIEDESSVVGMVDCMIETLKYRLNITEDDRDSRLSIMYSDARNISNFIKESGDDVPVSIMYSLLRSHVGMKEDGTPSDNPPVKGTSLKKLIKETKQLADAANEPAPDPKVESEGGDIPDIELDESCLLYTSPSPRDRTRSRMPSSA